jgi:hypothetical protein
VVGVHHVVADLEIDLFDRLDFEALQVLFD